MEAEYHVDLDRLQDRRYEHQAEIERLATVQRRNYNDLEESARFAAETEMQVRRRSLERDWQGMPVGAHMGGPPRVVYGGGYAPTQPIGMARPSTFGTAPVARLAAAATAPVPATPPTVRM